MIAKGRGSIINIASVSAHLPLSRVVAYSAAKAAVSKPTTSSMPASFGSAMVNPFDHEAIIGVACDRLRAKLSYTNLGFALAPPEFTISLLRDHYSAALGYRVSATNLQRVLSRRLLLEPTGGTAPPGPSGGRPAALFRFSAKGIKVTDPFAVLRPPGSGRPAGGSATP